MTSWKEAYTYINDGKEKYQSFEVTCRYEDVPTGYGATVDEAKDDFLENLRLKIGELTEMLEYCAKSTPKQVKPWA